jgi:hypothetical protein
VQIITLLTQSTQQVDLWPCIYGGTAPLPKKKQQQQEEEEEEGHGELTGF